MEDQPSEEARRGDAHGGCKPDCQVNDKEEEVEDQENGDDISAWDG